MPDNLEEFIEYLFVTDQLDEFMGLKTDKDENEEEDTNDKPSVK